MSSTYNLICLSHDVAGGGSASAVVDTLVALGWGKWPEPEDWDDYGDGE